MQSAREAIANKVTHARAVSNISIRYGVIDFFFIMREAARKGVHYLFAIVLRSIMA